MTPRQRIATAGGFTLIELLLVVGLLLTLLVMGVPSWRGSVERSEVGKIQQDLQRDLALARSEAVRRGNSVTLRCANCSAGPPVVGWESGWILFSDPNENQLLDAGEELIRQHEAMPEATVRLSANPSNRLSYQASGTMAGIGGTFTVCPRRADVLQARGLIYNSGGRVRVHGPNDTALSCP